MTVSLSLMQTLLMKYNIFLCFSALLLVAACSNPSGQATTIDVKYVTHNSLDGSKLSLSGRLTYTYDSALYYNLVSADSILYYRHKNEHGQLNIKTGIVDKNNSLDEDGRPLGGFEYELIPLFVNDAAYITRLETDTLAGIHKKTKIGDVALIERYYTEPGYDKDSLGQLLSEHTFLCYNQLTRRIYFEFNVMELSISGIPFTQKDFKYFTYPDLQLNLDNYENSIRKAKEYKGVSADSMGNDHLSNTIPDFDYADLQGSVHSSKNITQGYTLLEFWYVSCAPCLLNLQKLNDLYKRYNNTNINFVILNDTDKDLENIKEIKQKYNLKYNLYYKGEALKNTLNIQSHPCTVIYDNKTHKVLYRLEGTGANYVKEIDSILDSLTRIKK